MPHEHCDLDIEEIKIELRERIAKVMKLKQEKREAIAKKDVVAVGAVHQERLSMAWQTTTLCALRARHRGRRHITKFPFGNYTEEEWNKRLDEIAKTEYSQAHNAALDKAAAAKTERQAKIKQEQEQAKSEPKGLLSKLFSALRVKTA